VRHGMDYWIARLQQLANEGLADHPALNFERERYQQIAQIAAQMQQTPPGPSLDGLYTEPHALITPMTGVRAAVIHEGRVLLVHENHTGTWSLPGGFADVGQTPAGAAIQEVREESGHHIRVTKLVAVYNRRAHPMTPSPLEFHMFYFLCELIDGDVRDVFVPNTETLAAEFFPEDALPPLDATKITPHQIARCFAHYRDPSLPTEFD